MTVRAEGKTRDQLARRRFRHKSALSLSAFALTLILGSIYIWLGVLDSRPWQKTITVSMQLENSHQLLPGGGVNLRGIRIGDVETVERRNNTVHVTLRLDADFQVPVASSVKIDQLSALGEAFIDFEPMSTAGPYLTNGATVAVSRVPITIPQLFHTLSQLTALLGPTATGGVLETLAQATSAPPEQILRLQTAAALLNQLLTDKHDRTRTLAVNLNWVAANLNQILNSISSFGSSTGTLLVKGRGLLEGAHTLFDGVNAPDVFTKNLNPNLYKLDDQGLSRLLANLGPITAPLAPVIAALTDTAPGSTSEPYSLGYSTPSAPTATQPHDLHPSVKRTL